jgi:transcriptional regulator with XRE-family HTH domain
MSPETIRERAEAIRLGQRTIASRSGKSIRFVNLTLLGKSDPRWDNLKAIEDVVTAEELRLRDYLLGLHPVKREGEAA